MEFLAELFSDRTTLLVVAVLAFLLIALALWQGRSVGDFILRLLGRDNGKESDE